MLFQDIERLKSTVSTQDGQISEQSLLSEFGAEEVGGGQVDGGNEEDMMQKAVAEFMNY